MTVQSLPPELARPDVLLSPSEKYRTEHISYHGHEVTIVGISHHPSDRDRVPVEWRSDVENLITPQTLLFLEYFPPELENTVYNVPVLGKIARNYSDSQGITDAFGFCSDTAMAKGAKVAVADIANKAFFNIYEFGQVLPPFVAGPGLIRLHEAMQELGYPKIPAIEKMKPYMPYVDDARNVYTAKGIMQTTSRCDPNVNIVYLGSPQHASEVSRLIQSQETLVEKMKFLSYQAFMPGLDKNIRIYRPTESGWVRESKTRIR